ncbi:MAG TPA: TrmH family RNA methyltransferase [Streptosporangiaceae bacterium]|nr:TrmH family RNA methyltransferase [Streptosporangiaceae bacterium]
MARPPQPVRVGSRNATFQQWQALLTNRTKRHRAGEFLVQGVRPVSEAVRHGWTIRALLHDGRISPSKWAAELWETTPAAARFLVAPELMAELGEKLEGAPELLAVAQMPPDDLSRVEPGEATLLVTVFDRPTNPGNIGTLIRSADAFGGTGLVVTGHGADPYDPRCVRASTGSFFSVPVVRAPSHREVIDWVRQLRSAGSPVAVIGTDEDGVVDVRAADLTGPAVLVIGNETTGLTAAWRDECDTLVKLPMTGSASSLNAATAGSIVLYEAMRQRLEGP